MQVKVTKDKVLIVNNMYVINQGEFDINRCEFLFSEEYTEDLVKKAEFVSDEDDITILITGNECQVPYEMLNKDEFELRIYAFKIENEELILRYSPTPTTLYLREGSFKGASGEVITPSEIEQIEQELQNKQDKLVSGENIKTINNQSILGSGNLEIEGIIVNYEELTNKPQINNVEIVGNLSSDDLGLQEKGNYANSRVTNLEIDELFKN